MLSSMRRVLASLAFLFVIGCGGATTTEDVAKDEVNVDSLLTVMAERYDDLCARRKMAYRELDPDRRRELLQSNDAECKALRDSLDLLLLYREESKTK